MRTNIDINDNLMEEAARYAGARTKKQIIHDALELYVKMNRRKDVTDLAGEISFMDGFDPVKERRTGRFDR